MPPTKLVSNQLSEFRAAAEQAAKLGGKILMELLGQVQVWEKGPGDLVTAADYQSQKAIEGYLAEQYPEHDFLGEEDSNAPATPGSKVVDVAGQSKSKTSRLFCWIVDPLDGTTNFVHNLRSFSVSIALRYGDTIVAGAVFDPTTDECFSAAIGAGATLNGSPIKSGSCTSLDKALVVLSLKPHLQPDDVQLKRFLNVVSNVSSFRRLGSAALNCCYVGCGRLDAYWATSLSSWDVAAGWLIATEAGCHLSDFLDRPLRLDQPHFCLAATNELFEQLKPLLVNC